MFRVGDFPYHQGFSNKFNVILRVATMYSMSRACCNVYITVCVISGNRMVIALSSNSLLLPFNKLCSYRRFEWSTVRGCS